MVYGDSSAALAIAKRKGAGKMRHIHISCLWVQEMQGTKQLELRKVLGTENPADLMTKYLVRDKIDNAIDKMSQTVLEGRASSSLDIQGKVLAIRGDNDIAKDVEPNPSGPTYCGGARAPHGGETTGKRRRINSPGSSPNS